MLKTIISFILKISLDHPKKIMAGIMLVTIMCLFKISFLEFQFNIDEFLDDNQPQKILYRKILDEFNNDSNLFIIASGHNDSLKDFSSSINTLIKSFPHWIASIGNNISRDYLKKNMIKLFDLDELKEFDDIYNDPNLIQLLININNFFESHYLKSESLTNKQKKKLNDFINKLFHFVRIQKNIIIDELDLDNSSKAVNALLFGNGKSFSDDGKNMMIMIEPDYNMNLSMKKQIHSVNTIRMIIYDMAARHGVECSLVGPLAMKVDFFENFFVESKYMIMLSIISIFFILISLFRFYTSFNFCFIPIIFSFIWILGLYGFVFNALNLISIISAISCIVFILINCILFLLSCNKKNSEMNFVNDFFSEYAVKLFKTSLFLSSFSFIIYFSEVKFISMIGLMIGLGLIVSTILVLIIFSVMLAENKKKYHQYFYNDFTFDSLNNCFNFMFNFINKKRKIVFLFLSVFTCFSLFNSVNLVFEKSPSKIFHNHNENIELDFIEKFKFSSELFSYVVSDIDSARKIKKDLEHNELVGFVESFSDFVPNDNVEQERFRFIFEFNRKIRLRQLNKFFSTYEVEAYKNEIKRLEANFIELQHIAQINEDVDLYDKTKQLVGDGGPEGLVGLLTYFIGAFDDDFKKTRLIFFQDSFFGNMKSTLLDMANTEPVDISNIPYDIKKRLSNDANDQFRINVYSNFNTWGQYDDLQFFMNQLVMINNQIVGILLMQDVFIEKINSIGYDELILFALCFFVVMIFYSENKNYIFLNIFSFFIGSLWFFGGLVLLQQDLNIVNVSIFPVILIICLNNSFQIFENCSDRNKLIDYDVTFKSNIFSLFLVFMLFFPLSFSIHSSFTSIPIIVFYGSLCYLFANILIYGLFCVDSTK